MKQLLREYLAAVLSVMLVAGLLPPTSAAPQGEAASAVPSPVTGVGTEKNSDQPFQPMPGQSRTLLPDGRYLIMGGNGANGSTTSVWLLDSAGMARKLETHLLHARAWHTATLLPDGTVLIVGGVRMDGTPEQTAELFTPTTLMFEDLPQVGLPPLARHTATLLIDGRVLLAGGAGSAGESLLFLDSFTKEVVRTESSLKMGRLDHTARLLADGTVLLWGGRDPFGQDLTYGESVDPADSFTRFESTPEDPARVRSPRIEASVPEDRATDVPLMPLVAMRFSRNAAVTSVNPTTVVLSGPDGPVPSAVVPAENGMLAFVRPTNALQEGTTYTLSIQGVRDNEGAEFPGPRISFTTEGTDPSGREARTAGHRATADGLPALQAPPGMTAVSGRALTLDGRPLQGVSFRVDERAAKTDATGRFLLTRVPAGHHELVIDGRTVRGTETYGVFEVGVDVAPAKTTVLGYTVWMTPLDVVHSVALPVPTTAETVVTTPFLPGLEFHIPPGTTITDIDGNAVSQVSITPIPVDRPPFPLPGGEDIPLYFTIQPGSGYIHVAGAGGRRGGWLVYPNTSNSPPGTVFDFWNYDPEEKGWFVYGQGTVSADRKSIVPDPGVEIYELTGAMVIGGAYAPQSGPAPGGGIRAGDPVDPATGLFVYEKTDLFLSDVVPLAVTRTYRQNDSRSHAFGVGTTHGYDIFLVGDTSPYTYLELVLPDGGRVRFERTSPGTSYADAVYQNTSGLGEFFGATITWVGGDGWDLVRKDGTVLTFKDPFFLNNPLETALLSIRDRNGNMVTITRNSSGNVGRVTSPNGRYIDFTYDASNRVTGIQDNTGRAVHYTYDAGGRLIQVTDANNGLWTYAYDAANRMTAIQDARGIAYLQNQYDSTGRVILQTQADGGTYQFDYTTGASGTITQTDVRDPRGNVRRIVFNTAPASPNGFVSGAYAASETLAVGTPVQATVFAERQEGTNLPLTTTDVLGRTTAYTYDAQGNVTSITRLAGTSNAVTATFTYDATFGNLTSATDPLGHTTTFSYDPRGNLISAVDPLGNRLTFTYNTAGQVLTATDPNGEVTTFGYTGGDLTSVTDALGRTLTFAYDLAGRRISAGNAYGTTSQEYNPLDLVTGITDAAGAFTDLTYDPNGNLLTVTDPRNNTTTYTYDIMDRVASRKDALQAVESIQYDANGNVLQATDRRGAVTTLAYDALDRLVFAGYGTQPGPTYESTVSYDYDAADRLTQAADSTTGAVVRAYDDLDRLIAESSPRGSVSYAYDPASRRIATTVAGQSPINYSYDEADRLTEITQGGASVEVTYDAGGRRTSLTLPNGIVAEYTYNAASQVEEINYRAGFKTLGNLTYAYDARGLRQSAGGSLARVDLPAPLTATTYNGNNQLIQWNGTPLTYDADGNLISDGSRSYTWNTRNQLVSVAGPSTASFQYGPFGRRTTRSVAGVSTSYLYDGLSIIQELSGTTPTANLLIGALDEVLSRTDGMGTRTYLTDALGSPIALADATETIETAYTYEPFGKTSVSGAPSPNAYQFTGRENDGTGLYYYRSRYYDPSTQRFISEDPVGFQGGDTNLYGYVSNDPVNLIDPSGRNPLLAACAAGAAYSAAFDVGVSLLAHRKLDGGELLHDAAAGCLLGMTGFGVGRVLGKVVRGVRAARGVAAARPIVIGENMARVDAYASRVGGQIFDGTGMAANRAWIQEARATGRKIIDVGPDFGRRLERFLEGTRPDSIFYDMERMETNGYAGYKSVFQRSGRFDGGVPGLDW